MRMVIPIASELIRLVSVIVICDPMETAETSAAQANFPTIIRSTAPYMDWRKRATGLRRMPLHQG